MSPRLRMPSGARRKQASPQRGRRHKIGVSLSLDARRRLRVFAAVRLVEPCEIVETLIMRHLPAVAEANETAPNGVDAA